jgi:uncharacterized membrane protein
MAEITDFQVGQGETFKLLIQLKNRSNNDIPLDITDYSFTGQVRENYTTDEVAANFVFEKITPYTSGSVYIKLTPEQTLQLTQRRYVYDININSGSIDSTVRRILEGGLAVRPTVTR